MAPLSRTWATPLTLPTPRSSSGYAQGPPFRSLSGPFFGSHCRLPSLLRISVSEFAQPPADHLILLGCPSPPSPPACNQANVTLATILEKASPDTPTSKTWRLNERHYGGLTGLNKADTVAKHGEEQVKIWRRSFDVPPPPMAEDHECVLLQYSILHANNHTTVPCMPRTPDPFPCTCLGRPIAFTAQQRHHPANISAGSNGSRCAAVLQAGSPPGLCLFGGFFAFVGFFWGSHAFWCSSLTLLLSPAVPLCRCPS